MNTKTLVAISAIDVFNALCDLADVMDRGPMKDTANDIRKLALEHLEHAVRKLAK